MNGDDSTTAVTQAGGSPSPSAIDLLIGDVAKQNGLDPDLFRRQLIAESNLNPNAVSPAGAVGIAQFMPATAQAMGIDPRDPAQSIDAAGKLMRQHLNNYGGDINKALAAYNWGPGNIQRYGMDNMPNETRAYIAKITGGGPMVAQNYVQPPTQPPPPMTTQPELAQASLPQGTPQLPMQQPQGPPPFMPPGGFTLADAFTKAAQSYRNVNT